MDQACTEFYLAEDTDGFSRAVNRTIYDAFRTFTLTDVVGEDFQTIQQAAIQVTGGTATLAEDGRTVTWDLSGTEPYETYTMTLHLTLAPGQDGTYPAGTFATNQGESVLREQGTEKVQNQVASPQLRRGNPRRWRRWRWRGERPGIPSAMIPGRNFLPAGTVPRRNEGPAGKSTDTGGVYLHRLVWGGNIE